jgi:hypothetical protein
VREPSVISQVSEGTLVLFHMAEGTYFSLNSVGARLWELCDGYLTLQDVAATMALEFDAPPNVIETDTSELVSELLEAGLLEESPAQ